METIHGDVFVVIIVRIVEDDDDDDVSICWWLLFCEKEGVVHRSGCAAVFHHTIKARPEECWQLAVCWSFVAGAESSLLRCIEFLRFNIRHPSETVHGVAKCMTQFFYWLIRQSSYSYVI